MANSGQQGSFSGEKVGELALPLSMNPGTDCVPKMSFDISRLFGSTQNPTVGTPFNSQQRGRPPGTIHPISFWGQPSSDQTNINFQTTGTFDSQQHGQPAGRIHQICSSGQPSSDQTNINVQTTPIPKIKTQGQRDRHNESCRKSRAKKNKEEIEMKKKLKEFEDEKEKKKIENAELEHANVSMKRDILSLTDEKVQLESNLKTLLQQRHKQDAFLQELLKDKDLKKFIKVGVKHDMKPTQDQSPSDEESHSEKEISAGNLDGGESEDYNDYKKKKKRVARSAPREGRSGKVHKFAHYDAIADQRHGSTSNHTAMVRDPPSMTECIRILKTMGDISYSIVKKARAKFESPNEREFFVELTEDWRMDWVKELEDDA